MTDVKTTTDVARYQRALKAEVFFRWRASKEKKNVHSKNIECQGGEAAGKWLENTCHKLLSLWEIHFSTFQRIGGFLYETVLVMVVLKMGFCFLSLVPMTGGRQWAERVIVKTSEILMSELLFREKPAQIFLVWMDQTKREKCQEEFVSKQQKHQQTKKGFLTWNLEAIFRVKI